MYSVKVFIAFFPTFEMLGAALVAGHQIWMSTSEPAAQHLPWQELEKSKLNFSRAFQLRKGHESPPLNSQTSGTLHHSCHTTEAGFQVFN